MRRMAVSAFDCVMRQTPFTKKLSDISKTLDGSTKLTPQAHTGHIRKGSKMSRKLYALTDSEASELRRLVDAAQLRAWAEDDPDGYKDTHYLMARLNTPLDRDAAVDRMARALAESLYDGDFWDYYEDDGSTLTINREGYRSDARAALDALLGGSDDE